MKSDPALLPVPTFVQPDPFPADPKSGIQNRDALLRAAEESLATFVLEERGIDLGLGIRFEHDAVCGPQTTLSTHEQEEAMHLSFGLSGIEAAYKQSRDDKRKAALLGMIAELREMVTALRGGE